MPRTAQVRLGAFRGQGPVAASGVAAQEATARTCPRKRAVERPAMRSADHPGEAVGMGRLTVG